MTSSNVLLCSVAEYSDVEVARVEGTSVPELKDGAMEKALVSVSIVLAHIA